MSLLRAHAAALHGHLAELAPGGELHSISLDDGTVCIAVQHDKSHTCRINVVYTEADGYPSSGALVCCDEDDEELQDKLQQLSDRFQDRAPLSKVLIQVCAALAVTCNTARVEAVVTGGHVPSDAPDEAMDEGGGGGAGEDADDEVMAGSSDDTGGEFESQEEEDDDGDESDEEERALLMECGQRQGRWERHEADLEASVAASALSADQGLASRRQIFSAKEAFAMLSKELLNIIRQQDLTLQADSVGDDVYRWDVWLAGFKQGTPLEQDMCEVSRSFACSAIQLRFTFLRGLHPFYPPSRARHAGEAAAAGAPQGLG